jgi:hypothetical protein
VVDGKVSFSDVFPRAFDVYAEWGTGIEEVHRELRVRGFLATSCSPAPTSTRAILPSSSVVRRVIGCGW